MGIKNDLKVKKYPTLQWFITQHLLDSDIQLHQSRRIAAHANR